MPDVLEPRSEVFTGSRQMQMETQWVVTCLDRFHYSALPVEERDPAELLRGYLEGLDPSRLYFLAAEAAHFEERFSPAIVRYITSGNLYPAFRIFAHFRDRVQDRIDWVLQEIDRDYDFSGDGFFQTDRTLRTWPEDQATADALWRDRITFDLLNEVLPLVRPRKEYNGDDAPTPMELAEALEKARETIRRRYSRWRDEIIEMEAQDVQDIFLSSLTRSYDPHSAFLSGDSLEDFSISIENKLGGVGLVLTEEDGVCSVREVVANSPAFKSGRLSPGDTILAVGQGKEEEMVDIGGMRLRRIVRLIRGEPGTFVRLLVQPGNVSDPGQRQEILLEREMVSLTTRLAQARLIEVPASEGPAIPVGVIDLPSFYGGRDEGQSTTSGDVRELIAKLSSLGAEAIVLDLRRNGGGLLHEAVALTGLFVPSGPVVKVRNRHGAVSEQTDRSGDIAWDGPLAVLITRQSASASEIVAGALQSYRRAVILGDSSSHGKGTVQSIYQMNDNMLPSLFRPTRTGAPKVTTNKFYLPNGDSTQLKGVLSDIVVPSISEFLPLAESDIPGAMEWDRIEGIDFDHILSRWENTPARLDENTLIELRRRSDQRRGELDEFRLLDALTAFWQDRVARRKVSLNKEQRIAQKEEDNRLLDEFDSHRETLKALAFAETPILLDLAAEAEDALANREKMSRTGTSSEEVYEAVDTNGNGDSEAFDIVLREGLRVVSDWVLLSRPIAVEKPLASADNP